MSFGIHQMLLNGNISLPNKDIDFSLYNINAVNLLPGLDVFSNPFRCNAHSIADTLQYVCEQIVLSGDQLTEVVITAQILSLHHHNPVQFLPLLTIYEHLSQSIICSVHHYVMSLILKVCCGTAYTYVVN